MVLIKDSNFFKVPKKLLRDEQFKSLSPSVRVVIFYLLSLHNTFQGGRFYQKPKRLQEESGISRSTLWRMRDSLEKIGIEIKLENRLCYFHVSNFYERFIDKKDGDSW